MDRLSSWMSKNEMQVGRQKETLSPSKLSSLTKMQQRSMRPQEIGHVELHKDASLLSPKPSQSSFNHACQFEWERRYLIQACHQGIGNIDWQEILDLVQRCPQALWPVMKQHDSMSMSVAGRCGAHESLDMIVSIYDSTILGELCALPMGQDSHESKETTQTIETLIRTVLDLCPWQVSCSQQKHGHSPLRTAAKNPWCSPSILEALVCAANKTCANSVHMRDQDGLAPLDHVIRSAQSMWQTKYGSIQVDRLRTFLRLTMCEHFYLGTPMQCARSPLLILLSFGTSFGILPEPTGYNINLFDDEYGRTASRKENNHLLHIFDCSRLLLKWNPDLICAASQFTGCTPLHVAIRNYGNYTPLIRLLLEGSEKVMHHRNRFGDLPIHVACSVGVPMDAMRLICARTLDASLAASSGEPQQLVWSENAAGYTPVDLEWIRHIEGRHQHISNHSFYPLDTNSVRRSSGRSAYDVLLREAVEQTKGNISVSIAATMASSGSGQCGGALDLLLERIFEIVRISFHELSASVPLDLHASILHQASALSEPNGPTLPRPILELVLFQNPDQVRTRDATGKLPLHHVSRNYSFLCPSSIKSAAEWKFWVKQLLNEFPDGCQMADNVGRLPLHYILCCDSQPLCCCQSMDLLTPALHSKIEIVRLMVSTKPETVEAADPISHLYPFEMAAANPSMPLDIVFHLLRGHPGVIVDRN